MSNSNKPIRSILLCFTLLLFLLSITPHHAKADSIEFVLLSQYKATLDIGDELYVIAITTSGDMPVWKSSSSAIASVNTYGKVTAKKAGTATITAKIKNGEASCKVTVNKTKLNISDARLSMERGSTYQLTASTSNSSTVSWKSSKKSIAVIDENGIITGMKPGETTITAIADGTSKTCTVTVKPPTIKLNKTSLRLYRGQSSRLNALVSSAVKPTWKSSKSSVAKVDEEGTVTAIKHGTATISAIVDGIVRSCEITVEPPDIELSDNELHLTIGSKAQLFASVSSGNPVSWSTSNENVLSVSNDGVITSWQKGRAYVYASEDGTKVRCVVYVTENE